MIGMKEWMGDLEQEMQRVKGSLEFRDAVEMVVCGIHFKMDKNEDVT